MCLGAEVALMCGAVLCRCAHLNDIECGALLHCQDLALSQDREVKGKFESPGSRAFKFSVNSSAISALIFQDNFVYSDPTED